MDETEALVALAHIPHLGAIKIRVLIQQLGSACAALQVNPSEIAHWPGFGEKVIRGLRNWRNDDAWKRDMELAHQHHVSIISYSHAQFPKRLLELHDCPVLLYIKGTLKPCDLQSIAVVGTRHMSIYGYEMAKKISEELAGVGYTVVSGLARGIDTAAHRAALAKGRTIAIIGSGLADVYPRENISLSETIVQSGALISEFPMTTPPDRQNFPQRNRLVSGMTLGTLLIEAPLKSGAMITMYKALDQKRPLFALPGRVDNENFQGNHLLIKKGVAQLVENAQDITHHYEDLFASQGQNFSHAAQLSNLSLHRSANCDRPPLDQEEEHFLKQMPSEEISMEEIVQRTQIPVMKLNVLLMSLVLKRVIKEFPGKMYKKLIP